LNNGNTFQTVSLPLNQGDFYKDLLNGDTIPVEDGKITFKLESKQGKVLLMDY
jgi:pyruvate kinase